MVSAIEAESQRRGDLVEELEGAAAISGGSVVVVVASLLEL